MKLLLGREVQREYIIITSRNVGIVPNDPRSLVVEIGRDTVAGV